MHYFNLIFFMLLTLYACQSGSTNQEGQPATTPEPASKVSSDSEFDKEVSPKEQPAPGQNVEVRIKELPNTEAASPPRNRPNIVFNSVKFNFGEIYHGDKVQHDFVFTNQGNRDLEIKNVKVSCGCTMPSYPFLPIAPGAEGKIGVTYNSVGKQGYQRATVRVLTNDPENPDVTLRINGRVLVKSLEELEKEKQAKEGTVNELE